MSQHKNEVATRNQVKWRQDSVAIDFPGRDRNADNTRNTVATRTNGNAVTTLKTRQMALSWEARNMQS